jgi:hypothetical protein
MAIGGDVSVSEHLEKAPARVRPTLQAARKTVRAIAPKADEIGYRGGRPRSSGYMWKIARYAVDGANVVGIGTFPTHSTLFFYRGRELDDGSGLLQGGGKDMRFIRLRAPGDLERAAVKRMVRKAFRLGGVAAK